MKLTKKDKLKIIKELESGKTRARIAKEYRINPSTVGEIKRLYKMHGEKAFEVKEYHQKYTIEFKEKIIGEVRKGRALRDIATEYRIRHPMIKQWVQKYNNFGYNGLKKDQRGRPRMKEKENAKNKKQTPEQKIKELEKENKYLKMENEYLKKLDALVQERQQQQRKKK